MRTTTLIALAALSAGSAFATTVATEFNTSDGFTTGLDNQTVTVDSLVTFSGGQQQQMFGGGNYNVGPAGLLFINTGPGNPGQGFSQTNAGGVTQEIFGTGDGGSINFLGQGATTVSFFAANRANGGLGTASGAPIFTVFGIDGTTILDTIDVQTGALGGNDATFLIDLDSANFSQNIGSIVLDLPGPAGAPPYVVAIDSFTADVAVPEPSAALLSGLALSLMFRRRRES